MTFSPRVVKLGERSEQLTRVDLTLHTSARRGAEVVDESDAEMRRELARSVTAQRVDGGAMIAAEVRFVSATQAEGGGRPVAEPVSGKRYFCERTGEDLRVTTPEGDLPPMDEYAFVAANMEALGQASPLTAFLAGKTIDLGERVQLPPEVADKLLGIGEQLGAAQRFDLTLRKLVTIDGRSCAVFDAEIEAASHDRGQMRLLVAGTLTLEVEGCRALSAVLDGPIGMAETKLAPGGALQVEAKGKLRVAMRGRYRDPQ